jgi:hypothetical protein
MGKQVIDFSSQKKKSSKKSISKEKKEVSVDSSPSVACLFWLICFGLGEFDENCYEAKSIKLDTFHCALNVRRRESPIGTASLELSRLRWRTTGTEIMNGKDSREREESEQESVPEVESESLTYRLRTGSATSVNA